MLTKLKTYFQNLGRAILGKPPEATPLGGGGPSNPTK